MASITQAIDQHIGYHGGGYSSWYCGITADPNERFQAHDVTAASAAKYWDAGSEEEARAIERHFLQKGCLGGAGGGINPRYVYVYRA